MADSYFMQAFVYLAAAVIAVATIFSSQDCMIELISSPVRWQCPICKMEIQQGEILRCVLCEEPARMIEGDEIILEQLEMEIPDV